MAATSTGSLDVRELTERAARDADVGELDDDPFRPGLEQLVASLADEAALHAAGRAAVHAALLHELKNRLFARAALNRHNAIGDTAIEQPVFVVGLLRTGTTFLHNLLAQHPELYAPALWELAFPVSERPAAVDDDELRAEAQRYVDEYNRVAPALETIHYLHADRPDECHRLTGNAFMSKVYEMRYRVPGYGDWLARQSMLPAYRHHRRLLQHIAWRRRCGRLVLKCPFHFWHLPELLSVYPDARVVLLHRDVRKVVPSMSSLCCTIRAPRSDDLDRAQVAAWVLRDVTAGVDRMLRWRADAARANVLDVRYHDLVRDRERTLARILAFVGLPASEGYSASVRDWLRDDDNRRSGRHRYDAADFGLDTDDIAARFSDYHQRFDIPVERT